MSILSFSKKHTASEDTYVFLECEERDGKYTAGQKIAVSVDDLPQNLDLEKWGFTVNQRTRNNQQRFRYTLVKTPLPSQRQE